MTTPLSYEARLLKLQHALLTCPPEKLPAVEGALLDVPPPAEAPEIRPPVTQTEAARLLGRDRTTIWRWVKNGTILTVTAPGCNPVIPYSEILRLAGAAQ